MKKQSPAVRTEDNVRTFPVASEEREIQRLIQEISRCLLLAEWKKTDLEEHLSVRSLLRKKHAIPFCSLIHSVPEGLQRCINSDRRLTAKLKEEKSPCCHYCHAGLIDFAFPVEVKEFYIPVIGGQLLFEAPSEEKKAKILSSVSNLPLDPRKLKKALENIPVIPLQTIKGIISLINTILREFPEREAVIMIGNMSGADSAKYKNLHKLITHLKSNYSKKFSISELAKKMRLSPYYMEHLFKKEMGVPVMKYVNRLRVEGAKELLRNTDIPVTQIAFSLGWSDSNYFSNVFRKETGLSPSGYRKAVGEHKNPA